MSMMDWSTDREGNPKYSWENVYNATMLATNLTQSGLELNPGLYNEGSAANSLSY
jgi:hypothetical protein